MMHRTNPPVPAQTVGKPDVHELAKRLATAERLLSDLLLMPHRGLGGWARTNACIHKQHPAKSERFNGCPCGKRKDSV
jgi:hypothetical protein